MHRDRNGEEPKSALRDGICMAADGRSALYYIVEDISSFGMEYVQ